MDMISYIMGQKSAGGGSGGVSNFADLEDVTFPEDPDIPNLFLGQHNGFSFVPRKERFSR